jgi:hypothetical protein
LRFRLTGGPVVRIDARRGLAPTTLAQLIGHADAGLTLPVYARDARDKAAVVADVSPAPALQESAPRRPEVVRLGQCSGTTPERPLLAAQRY